MSQLMQEGRRRAPSWACEGRISSGMSRRINFMSRSMCSQNYELMHGEGVLLPGHYQNIIFHSWADLRTHESAHAGCFEEFAYFWMFLTFIGLKHDFGDWRIVVGDLHNAKYVVVDRFTLEFGKQNIEGLCLNDELMLLLIVVVVVYVSRVHWVTYVSISDGGCSPDLNANLLIAMTVVASTLMATCW